MSHSRAVASRRGRVVGMGVAAALAVAVLPGCGPVDRGEDLVSRAVTTIDAAPGNWRSVGTELIAQPGDEGSALLDEVQSLYSNALGQTQNFTFCAVDFFGARFGDGLRMVLHDVDPARPEPALAPVVCNTDPPTAIEVGSTRLVTLYGYDFAVFARQHPYTVGVEYKDGSTAMESVGSLSATSNYQIGVDVQAVDFGALDAARGPKLVVQWGADDVIRASGARTELPILLPVRPTVRYSTFDVRVEKHADSGAFEGSCTQVDTTVPVLEAGMVIDTGNGDPQHPGVSELTVEDNRQSVNTLREYNYRPISPTAVLVSGRVCGAGGWGPGAIFSRSYRIFLRSP